MPIRLRAYAVTLFYKILEKLQAVLADFLHAGGELLDFGIGAPFVAHQFSKATAQVGKNFKQPLKHGFHLVDPRAVSDRQFGDHIASGIEHAPFGKRDVALKHLAEKLHAALRRSEIILAVNFPRGFPHLLGQLQKDFLGFTEGQGGVIAIFSCAFTPIFGEHLKLADVGDFLIDQQIGVFRVGPKAHTALGQHVGCVDD